MRMLGDMRQSWCRHCRAQPGPDCPDWGHSTRGAKRREQRAVRDETSLLVVPSAREADLDRRLTGGDCRHGCNGDCITSGSERCDFTCHEARCENCTAPARHWLDTGWFCSPECYGEYGLQLIQGLRQ